MVILSPYCTQNGCALPGPASLTDIVLQRGAGARRGGLQPGPARRLPQPALRPPGGDTPGRLSRNVNVSQC